MLKMVSAYFIVLILGLGFSTVVTSASLGSCLSGQSCVPIRSCKLVMDMLEGVKELSTNSGPRIRMIKEARHSICGSLADRTVCCDADHQGQEEQQKILAKIGSFSTLEYGVSGDVFALGPDRILIKNFKYNGGAPAAFFVGGRSGKPDNKNVDIVLPHPYKGRHYSYEEDGIPSLTEKTTGEEDIVLTLPPGTEVGQLAWLAVHCRQYNLDFGNVFFPPGFVV